METSEPIKKRCSKCEGMKDFNEFHKNKATKDGAASWCKSCVNEHVKVWLRINKEKFKTLRAKYYKKNKEKIKAAATTYYYTHKKSKNAPTRTTTKNKTYGNK